MIRLGNFMFAVIALCTMPLFAVEMLAEPMQETAFLNFEWPPDVAVETNSLADVNTEDFERLTSFESSKVEPTAGEYVPPLFEVGWQS